MILAALWIYVLVGALGLSLMLTPLCERASRRLGILDRPGIRKIHGTPMPLLGGCALFLSFTIIVVLHTALALLLAASPSLQALAPEELVRRVRHVDVVIPRLAVLFLGGVIVFLIGLADDVRGLPARRRFAMELAVASLVVILGIRPDYPDLPQALLVVVAVIWITGITNAFNLIDSMDGLAGGVGVIAAGGLALLVGLRNQPLVVALLLALAGAIGGVLRYNLYPARVFLGSSGTMFAGYTLAVAFLFATFHDDGQPGLVSVAVPLLVLGLPLFDTTTVMLRRILAGRSPFQPDRLHVAHQLMRLGLTQRQGAALLHLVAVHGVAGALLIVMGPASLHPVILVQAAIPYGVLLLLMRRRRHRAEERIAIPWTGRVAVEGGAEGEGREAAEVRLVDVAPRGIGITVETRGRDGPSFPAARDAPRCLSVSLDGPRGPVRFRGRTRWSCALGDGTTRAGIEIEEIDPADRERLEEMLHGLARE